MTTSAADTRSNAACQCDLGPEWAQHGGPAAGCCPHDLPAKVIPIRDQLMLLMARYTYRPEPGDIFNPLNDAADKYIRDAFGPAYDHISPQEYQNALVSFLRYVALSSYAMMLQLISELEQPKDEE